VEFQIKDRATFFFFFFSLSLDRAMENVQNCDSGVDSLNAICETIV
jgi:hypothetical protein